MYILQDGKYFCLSVPLIIRKKKIWGTSMNWTNQNPLTSYQEESQV